MDVSTMKAKIAGGVLPSANGIAVHHIRFASGLCVGCGTRLVADGVGGLQFEIGSKKHLLHVDCYVIWTEACADDATCTE